MKQTCHRQPPKALSLSSRLRYCRLNIWGMESTLLKTTLVTPKCVTVGLHWAVHRGQCDTRDSSSTIVFDELM